MHLPFLEIFFIFICIATLHMSHMNMTHKINMTYRQNQYDIQTCKSRSMCLCIATLYMTHRISMTYRIYMTSIISMISMCLRIATLYTTHRISMTYIYMTHRISLYDTHRISMTDRIYMTRKISMI